MRWAKGSFSGLFLLYRSIPNASIAAEDKRNPLSQKKKNKFNRTIIFLIHKSASTFFWSWCFSSQDTLDFLKWKKKTLLWCCLACLCITDHLHNYNTVSSLYTCGYTVYLQYSQRPGIHILIFTGCITWTHSLNAIIKLLSLSNTSDKGGYEC